MKIKTKPIAMAGLAAVCAATLVTGAALIGNNYAHADDQSKINASSYFGDNLYMTENGVDVDYPLAKKFYGALDEMNKAGDFADGKVHYNITEKIVTPAQIKGWVEDGDLTVPKAFSAARDAFLTDHPEIFYIDFYKMTISAGRTNGVYSAFIDSGREANLYRDNGLTTQPAVAAAIKNFDAKIDEIVATVTAKQEEDTYSARDVFLAREVNKYLAENIKYDYAAYENKDDENYIAAAYINTSYGGLVEGKAVCGGFSTAYKVIMDKLGVPCITVNGYSNQMDEYGNYDPSSVYHMWNYVYLEAPEAAAAYSRAATGGAWYSVDVTWSHSSFNKNKYAILQKYSDDKIHVSDGEISSSKYKLKYPELSAHNYGATGETDGLQVSIDYQESDEIANIENSWITVSYNGKSAKRLLEEDGLHIVYREGGYKDGKPFWTEWRSLAQTMLYMSIGLGNPGGDLPGFLEDTGTESVYYQNTANHYTEFAVFDAAPDLESPEITAPGDYYGKTIAYKYSEKLLNESQPVASGKLIENEAYGTYTPPPYVQSSTPNFSKEQTIYDDMGRDGVMYERRAQVIEVTFNEPLHKLDANKPITVTFESAHPNAKKYAKFYPVNEAGDMVELVQRKENSGSEKLVYNTLRFKFGASLMYEHNREGYHFYFGNVGSAKIIEKKVGNELVKTTSDKAPNAPYFTFSRFYLACPARFNYDGRLWIESCAQPVLADNSDLSANNFLKEDGTSSFSEGERSQMMLVAEKIDKTTENTMKNEILGGDNNVVSEEELSKSQTYDIKLQICNKYPTIPDGSYVKIMLGFPEGYGPDDEGVRFKLYHRKHIKETDTYIIEEVPCVVTKLGIVATVTSFSPYMVVPVDAAKVTDKTVVASINGSGGKLSAEDGQIRVLKEGESYTYTVTPDKGYQIYSVTLNGKLVTDKIVDGKLTVNYADLADDNQIEIKYIANEAVQHVKENNIVTPATVVMGTDESTEKVGEVIDTPDHIEIVTPDPEPTPDPTPDPEPTPDPTPDPEPEKNKDHTTVIIIMCVVIGVAVIAGIAVVVVLRKRKE